MKNRPMWALMFVDAQMIIVVFWFSFLIYTKTIFNHFTLIQRYKIHTLSLIITK